MDKGINIGAFKSEILEELEQREEYKNSFKNINITNKDEAFNFLKQQTSPEALFYAYSFSLSYELKSDEEIYDYLKEKFMFNKNSLFRDYSRSFVHDYGEACGKTNNTEKINSALSKVKKFIKEGNLYYGYWMFYSLYWATTIDFETYLEIYKLFEKETNIQGNLLGQYRNVNKEESKDYHMIRLLDASSDECIKENWYMAVDYNFFSVSLYNVLLRRNVSKEDLDKLNKQHSDYQKEKRVKEIEEQEEKAKCLRKQKRKEWLNKWKH